MHARRLWGVAATAALAVGITAPSSAAPSRNGPDEANEPTDQPDISDCTLGSGEWKHCLQVRGHLNHAPKQGQSALLTVRLKSSADLDDVAVDLALPDGLAWKKRPKGFSGESAHATVTTDTEAGGTVTYRGLVQAEETMAGAIRLDATTDLGGVYDSSSGFVPLTVAKTPQESFLGYGEGPHPTEPSSDGPQQLTSAGSFVKASTTGLPKPHSDDEQRVGIQAETCVEGSWMYDLGAGWLPSQNFQVEVWDSDPVDDDLLASGVTDANGQFDFCFENDDGIGGGGQDVYLHFVASNASWRVGNEDDDQWVFETETRDDVASGETETFWGYHPTNDDLHHVLQVFDTVNTAWLRTPGDCWDARDDECRQIGVLWPMDEGGVYWQGDDEVHLDHGQAEQEFVISHEIGHGVMDDVYEDDFPDSGDGCSTHYVNREESDTCAWTEGFADWYGLHATGTSDTDLYGDFDDPTWGTQDWDTGADVEGRIAGALWDLHDTGWEAYWDGYSENLSPVWDTFLDNRSTSFRQFWTQRGDDGHASGDTQMAALYQNTIDFGFRNPLPNGRTKTIRSPEPPGEHNYKIRTQHRYWSVVAMQPPSNTDYDLRLFLDRLQLFSLGRSRQSHGRTDFIAIDSNVGHFEPRYFYPRVEPFDGAGDYQIQFADPGDLMPVGSVDRAMGAADRVDVLDVCESEKRTITVTPSNGSQDADLYLMGSQSGGGGAVQPRVNALASAEGNGVGEEESLTFDPPGLDCYGLVLVNESGSGTYTLTME